MKEERRESVRFPTDKPILFGPAGAKGEPTETAKVRNISRGGVNMLVNREMKPGDILSVQLPSESEKGAITVLGCVVHVKLEGENIWSVGLTFARELNPRDLAPFGSFDDKTADQRNRPRYKCETEANYQLVTTTDEKQHPAKVLNISSTGIGLMVDQMVPTGTLLSVEMHANDPETARTILSCVVHLSPQQENQWALGCNFITELSEKDLSVFV